MYGMCRNRMVGLALCLAEETASGSGGEGQWQHRQHGLTQQERDARRSSIPFLAASCTGWLWGLPCGFMTK